jgi:putative (di)nucleoside polyphosphate hydrolase
MFTQETKSAGGVVVNPEGKILLVSQHGDSWSLPKGRIERGEEPIDAARREIYEESGVSNLTFVKPLPSYKRFRIGPGGKGEDRSERKTIQMFLFRTDDSALQPVDPENPEARWVERDEAAGMLTHLKDQEFFRSIMLELR